MSNLLLDLRYAARTLLKQPGFTFIAVVTLALGIGANTAIFSIINSVLLAPLPYPEQDRLVVVSETDKTKPGEPFAISLPDYLDWRRDATSFGHLALTQVDGTSISDIPGQIAEQIPAAFVTANFFNVIGLSPKIGRTFSDDEDRAGAPPVVVISDRLWQRKFARSPAILGQTLMLQNRPTTVIGVMPPEMNAPGDVDAWFSIMRRADNPAWPNRIIHPNLYAWARLKRGVSLEQTRTEMRGIAARIEQANLDTNKDITALITPVLESMVGKYRTNLALLLGAVALVLLIACANLANLFAVRGASRAREFAIRAAIGASRQQLVRQLLIESLVIASLGGMLGLLLALWSRDALVALAPEVARFQTVSFNAPVLIFTFAVTALTSILAGLLPAWQSSRADIQLALKSGAQTTSETKAARRTRDLLVIADVALTLVLLSSAGLVLKSFARMQSLALGFQPIGLTTGRITLPYSSYRGRADVAKFGKTLVDKIATLPGVEKIALGSNPPLLAGWMVSFYRDDLPVPPLNEQPGAESEVVAGDYLGALQTTLLRGRAINERDTMDAPPICMIDQTLAEKYFAGEDPIGKRISSDPDGNGNENRSFEIVGVVSRVKFHGAEPTPAKPVIYYSLGQVERHRLILLVRSALPAYALEKSLREIVAGIDPRQPVYEIRPMSELVAQTWATQRLLTFLLSVFAGLALGLASIGLYGVLAYTALKRIREIGIRIALGARPAQVGALIMNHALRLLSLGCMIGLIGALATSRVLQSVLFQTGQIDLQIYFIVGGILFLATLLASWLPARRACKVDPIVALRVE